MATTDWDDLRFFLALARSGSVRGAGAALGVSHSTVARRVEAFEVRLGARLFDRSRDGYQLTDAGARMVPDAEAIEARLAQLERGVLGADTRFEGPVHLTCWDSVAAELLLPCLMAFTERYPKVELRVTADTRSVNLSLREADVALRVLGPGMQPPEHLMGRKLVPMALASYVAVAHAGRLDPDAAGGCSRWLGYEDPAPQVAAIATSAHPDLPVWGSFDSLELMAAAVRAGLGMGMLPCYIGDRDPLLQRVQRPDVRPMADVWLLSHPDLRTTARLRALRACVQEAMEGLRRLYAGEAG